MANLYSGKHTYTGYKAISEITDTEISYVVDTEYQIQIAINDTIRVREGETGDGYILHSDNPFTWKYDGENDLFIENPHGKLMYINVSD